jgi:hypothetical protein
MTRALAPEVPATNSMPPLTLQGPNLANFFCEITWPARSVRRPQAATSIILQKNNKYLVELCKLVGDSYEHCPNSHSNEGRDGACWTLLSYVARRVTGNRRGSLCRSEQRRRSDHTALRRRFRPGGSELRCRSYIAKSSIGFGRSAIARYNISSTRLSHHLGWRTIPSARSSFFRRLSQILGRVLRRRQAPFIRAL